MYSLTINDNGALTFKVSAVLPDLMDKFLVAKRNGLEAATLVNLSTRKVLRHVENAVKLPALKLSDAMTRALSTTTKDGYVTGAANTLKALANKGLLQANGAKYQITNLGRQYQKKGA